MHHNPEQILSVLDRCCDAFTFPMLDNGYVFLAATRLSLFRSSIDWAIVIEVFGFSPRSGVPDTHVHTFASKLTNRNLPAQYVTREAYDNYLANNAFNESRFVHPMAAGPWIDEEDPEFIGQDAKGLILRGRRVKLPSLVDYETAGIELRQPQRIQIFELCRAIAHLERDAILATPKERRASVPRELQQILVLDEWSHPDVVKYSVRPSGSVTFQQLARVLATGEISHYRTEEEPNTHWRNWPDGGSL